MSHFDSIVIDLFAVIGVAATTRFLIEKTLKGWRARRKPLTLEQLQVKWQGVPSAKR